MLTLLFLTGLTAFPLPTIGNTWIVDDDGGAGVHFTTLQAAFDVAQTNDVVIVEPGTYAGATLTRAVRVIGRGAAHVAGQLVVRDIAVGFPAVVSGLRFTDVATGLAVRQCAGTVVGDDLRSRVIESIGNADLRMHRSNPLLVNSTLFTSASRVELVESELRGANGASANCAPPAAGQYGASVSGGELRAARSSIFGGFGGDVTCNGCWSDLPPGAGGHGVQASLGAWVVIAGSTTNQVFGGAAGQQGCGEPYGVTHGHAAYVTGPGGGLRVSGITMGSSPVFGGVVHVLPTPPDPTLRLIGTATPGALLTLRVHATGATSARVELGALPTVVPIGTHEEDVLVRRARSVDLGTVPANGIVDLPFAVPASWPVGTVIFAQAVVTFPSGPVRRTNSVPLVVR